MAKVRLQSSKQKIYYNKYFCYLSSKFNCMDVYHYTLIMEDGSLQNVCMFPESN